MGMDLMRSKGTLYEVVSDVMQVIIVQSFGDSVNREKLIANS